MAETPHTDERVETRPGAHPGETVCEGCIHGPACRVIPCADCGKSWHLLGSIGKPPFICPRCEDEPHFSPGRPTPGSES